MNDLLSIDNHPKVIFFKRINVFYINWETLTLFNWGEDYLMLLPANPPNQIVNKYFYVTLSLLKILKNMCDSDRITYFLACFGQSQDMIRHIFHTFLKDTRNDEPKQNSEASNKSIDFSSQVQRCERNQQDQGLAQKDCKYMVDKWTKQNGHDITIIEL